MGFLLLEINHELMYNARKSRFPLFALTDLADNHRQRTLSEVISWVYQHI